MISEVLESDVLTKSKTIFHPESDGDRFVLEEQQDAEDIVEANRYQYNLHDERSPWKETFNKVASIPLVVFFDQWKKGMWRGAKMGKDEKKWLNDSDNRFFRTRPGRV